MDRFQHTRQPDWNWWGKLWPTPGETLRQLGLSAGDTLLDIACGNGYFTLPAARIVDPAPVYALDIDASVLSELDHLAAQQHVDNVEPIEGDACSLADHVPDTVDVALIANTFHGIDDPTAFVDETLEVLADDGRFVVVDWRALPREMTTIEGTPRGPPTERRLSAKQTRDTVTELGGLMPVAEIDMPPYHYALVFERE